MYTEFKERLLSLSKVMHLHNTMLKRGRRTAATDNASAGAVGTNSMARFRFANAIKSVVVGVGLRKAFREDPSKEVTPKETKRSRRKSKLLAIKDKESLDTTDSTNGDSHDNTDTDTNPDNDKDNDKDRDRDKVHIDEDLLGALSPMEKKLFEENNTKMNKLFTTKTVLSVEELAARSGVAIHDIQKRRNKDKKEESLPTLGVLYQNEHERVEYR